MYDFWYDYLQLKYGKKSKIMLHGYSFKVYIKTDDTYINIVKDVETIFDTSTYE